MRCDSCKYWELRDREINHPNDKVGKCRRYPPQLDTIYAGKCEDEGSGGCEAIEACWYQPLTIGSDWCGEHFPNPEAKETAHG